MSTLRQRPRRAPAKSDPTPQGLPKLDSRWQLAKPEFAGEWVPFDRAFAEVSRGVKKFGQNEYLDQGEHPIIDQGKNAIAGYSNEQLGMFKDVPAIVFGDHTRVFKYVDRPFFIGADGVKILKPLLSENVLFWYYALCAANIENLGYSRHFKLLKEKSFLNSSHEDQASITQILETVDEQISLSNSLLSSLDNLVKSQFVEMFGDPRLNTKEWPLVKLGDVASTRLGKMLDAKKQTGLEARPYLANTDVQWFRFNLENLKTMDFDVGDRKEFALRDGDVLATEGGEVGRCAIWHCELEECYFQKAVHRIRCDSERLLPIFLAWTFKMKSERNLFGSYVSRSTIAHLTGEKLRKVPIQLPPLALQQQFADFVAKVDKLGFGCCRMITYCDALFSSVSARLLRT